MAIVNGEKEFIGSNPIAFREAVMSVVSNTPTIEILASASMETNYLAVEYKSNKSPATYVVNIALVETSVDHFIPRGDNRGRTLRHYNIVRSFSTSTLKTGDRITLPWPKDLAAANSSVTLVYTTFKIIENCKGCTGWNEIRTIFPDPAKIPLGQTERLIG